MISESFSIVPIIAPQPLECFRCLDEERVSLIFAGEQCVEISKGDKIEFACMDCYNRLFAEIIGDEEF